MHSPLSEIADINSTIAAISTPPGKGGIAVIRVSGNDAVEIADKVWRGKSLTNAKSHSVHFGKVLDTDNNELDEALATVFIAPASFTGQNTVEFAVHGSVFVQRELLESLIKNGARQALPGEFTRRAFISGKLGLTQAEAIADIIGSESRAAHRLAMSQLKGNFGKSIDNLRDKLTDLISLLELELDFSEEDVSFADRSKLNELALEIRTKIQSLLSSFRTGNAIKSGIPVAIVGPTNAGKSSLLNALLGHERAIVSDIQGTTRDTIEETAEIGDYLFRFVDTAGLRDTSDPIEIMGIERSRKAVAGSHIILIVVDATLSVEGEKYASQIKELMLPHQTALVLYNKSDLVDYDCANDGLLISAKENAGVDTLKKVLNELMTSQQNKEGANDISSETAESILVTNQRHATALETALKDVDKMIETLNTGLPTDLVAQDARQVITDLAEITGQITDTDILSTIFSRFCIGK